MRGTTQSTHKSQQNHPSCSGVRPLFQSDAEGPPIFSMSFCRQTTFSPLLTLVVSDRFAARNGFLLVSVEGKACLENHQ